MTKIETQTPATAGIQNEAILEADTNNPTALESPSEFFSHGEGDSPRSHAAEKTRLSVLGFAVLLTLSFSVIELVGGWWANSLALIGDAGHMVTDSMSLLFALVANRLAMKGADEANSFGHGRVEVIAAFVNGLTWLLLGPCRATARTSIRVRRFCMCSEICWVQWRLSPRAASFGRAVRLLSIRSFRCLSVFCSFAQPGKCSANPYEFCLTARLNKRTLMLSANTSAQCPVWMKFMIFIYGRLPRGMMLCSATCALRRTSAGRGSCTPFAKASRGALISTTLRFSPSGKAWDRAGIVKVRSA